MLYAFSINFLILLLLLFSLFHSFFCLPACLPAFTSFHFIQQPNHSIAFSFCLILHTLCILLQMCHFPLVLLYSAASQLLCVLWYKLCMLDGIKEEWVREREYKKIIQYKAPRRRSWHAILYFVHIIHYM